MLENLQFRSIFNRIIANHKLSNSIKHKFQPVYVPTGTWRTWPSIPVEYCAQRTHIFHLSIFRSTSWVFHHRHLHHSARLEGINVHEHSSYQNTTWHGIGLGIHPHPTTNCQYWLYQPTEGHSLGSSAGWQHEFFSRLSPDEHVAVCGCSWCTCVHWNLGKAISCPPPGDWWSQPV